MSIKAILLRYISRFAECIYKEIGSRFDVNMKKYNEDDANCCVMCRLGQYLVRLGSYAMRLTSVVLRQNNYICANAILSFVM